MLDFFVIFNKGGIVLWCCQGPKDIIVASVNSLIRSVFLQERTGNGQFEHGALMLQYKLDNEFELVYVAGYQKVLKLSYVDKFLDDIHQELRDRYKNVLGDKLLQMNGLDLDQLYLKVLKEAEIWGFEMQNQKKAMRSFEESRKSKKTVSSMIERPNDEKNNKKSNATKSQSTKPSTTQVRAPEPVDEETEFKENEVEEPDSIVDNDGVKFIEPKILPKGVMRKPGPGKYQKSPKTPGPANKEKEEKGKKPRIWDNGGSTKDLEFLERTKDAGGQQVFPEIVPDRKMIGTMIGNVKSLAMTEEFKKKDEDNKSSSGGVFNIFKGLVSGKSLTADDIAPALDKLKDHLIAKNVATDVSQKLCDSVAKKLEGKVLGTFQTVNSTVKAALEESLLSLLQPKRQVDVLREALEAKRQGRPYIVTFCGVNGVGKSTNLAKICFWLIENGLTVMVAACDTFRAGAVEQLRTHARHLNALHPSSGGPPFVQLYEKGYGKDAAGVAAEAINFAKDSRINVVLVDTAGRMQDNEPLMRALSKLIRVNNPDLVLFVGEALVGNEAVDQLVKFNRALADFSDQADPRLIDGIVLTKFDTIDDKVGAAVSMTYITGQPIVFVGTGQTYTDLKALDSRAVVNSLLK